MKVSKLNTVKDLGVVLKKNREESGLSQADVAKKFGYTTAQFVSNWERGLVVPPLSTLKKLCKLYDFPEHKIQKKLQLITIEKWEKTEV